MECLTSNLDVRRFPIASNSNDEKHKQQRPSDAIVADYEHENAQKHQSDCRADCRNISAVIEQQERVPSFSPPSPSNMDSFLTTLSLSLDDEPSSSSMVGNAKSPDATCANHMVPSDNTLYHENNHLYLHSHPFYEKHQTMTNKRLLDVSFAASTAKYSSTTTTPTTNTQIHSTILATTTKTLASTSQVIEIHREPRAKSQVHLGGPQESTHQDTDHVVSSLSSSLVFKKSNIARDSEHTRITMASTRSLSPSPSLSSKKIRNLIQSEQERSTTSKPSSQNNYHSSTNNTAPSSTAIEEVLQCNSSDSGTISVTRNWKEKYDCARIDDDYDEDNYHLGARIDGEEIVVYREGQGAQGSSAVVVDDCASENELREFPPIVHHNCCSKQHYIKTQGDERTVAPALWSCSSVPACINHKWSDNKDSLEQKQFDPSSYDGGEDDESRFSWFINVLPHQNLSQLTSTSTLDIEAIYHNRTSSKTQEEPRTNPADESDPLSSEKGKGFDDDHERNGNDWSGNVVSHAPLEALATELNSLLPSKRNGPLEVNFYEDHFDVKSGDSDQGKKELHDEIHCESFQQTLTDGCKAKQKETVQCDSKEAATRPAESDPILKNVTVAEKHCCSESHIVTVGHEDNDQILNRSDLFLSVTETITALPQMLCITPREQHLLIQQKESDDIHEDNNREQVQEKTPTLVVSAEEKCFLASDEKFIVNCNNSPDLFSKVTDACSCITIRKNKSNKTMYKLPWDEFQIPPMQSSSSSANITVNHNNIEVELNADSIEVELKVHSDNCDQEDTVEVVDAVVRALRKSKKMSKRKTNAGSHELPAVDSGPPDLGNFSEPKPPTPDTLNVLMSLTRMECCGEKQNHATVLERSEMRRMSASEKGLIQSHWTMAMVGCSNSEEEGDKGESSTSIEPAGEEEDPTTRHDCPPSKSKSIARDHIMDSDSFSIDIFHENSLREDGNDRTSETKDNSDGKLETNTKPIKKPVVLMVPLRREETNDRHSTTATPFHELSSTISTSFEFVTSLSSDDHIPSPPQNAKKPIPASNVVYDVSVATQEDLEFIPPEKFFVLPSNDLPSKVNEQATTKDAMTQQQHTISSLSHLPPAKPSKNKSVLIHDRPSRLPPLSPALRRNTPRGAEHSPKASTSNLSFSNRDEPFDNKNNPAPKDENEIHVSLSLSLSEDAIPPSPKHTELTPIAKDGRAHDSMKSNNVDIRCNSLSLSTSSSEDSSHLQHSPTKAQKTPYCDKLETDPLLLDAAETLAKSGRTQVVPHLAINRMLQNAQSNSRMFVRSRPPTPRFQSTTEALSPHRRLTLGHMAEDSLRIGRKCFPLTSSSSTLPQSFLCDNKVDDDETNDGYYKEQENQSPDAKYVTQGMKEEGYLDCTTSFPFSEEDDDINIVPIQRPTSVPPLKGILKTQRCNINEETRTKASTALGKHVHWDEKQLSNKIEKGIMILTPRNKNKLSHKRPALALQRLRHEITAVQDGYGSGLEMLSSFPQRPQGYFC